MGGRTGRPFSYMSGKTDFNSELFGAEHLVIADENSNRDMNSRRLFGSRIKDYTVNTSMHCHGKFREALTLTPCQRLTISLNDEDDNLLILENLWISFKTVVNPRHNTIPQHNNRATPRPC